MAARPTLIVASQIMAEAARSLFVIVMCA
jgi:hypothetical protein